MDGGEKLLLSSVKATEKTAKFESAFDLLTCDWLFCRTHHPLTLSLSHTHTHTSFCSSVFIVCLQILLSLQGRRWIIVATVMVEAVVLSMAEEKEKMMFYLHFATTCPFFRMFLRQDEGTRFQTLII